MPTKPKLPKARLMVLCDDEMLYPERAPAKYRSMIPCLVAEFPSLKSAKAFAKFWAMTPEERVERLAAGMQAAIPNNWVDDLLTGPNAALRGKGGTWGCQDVERLLNAIKQKMPQAARAGLAAMGGGTK